MTTRPLPAICKRIRRLRRYHRLPLILCIGALCSPLMGRTANVYSESAVKAAFVSRFIDYIEWPQGTLTKPNFVVAVFNDEEVSKELIKLLGNRSLKTLPARVQKIQDLREAADVQVLYIGSVKSDDLRSITQALANRPILLIANGVDNPDSVSINFVRTKNRIQFEVSLNAAETAGLKIDAGLSAVAAKVYGAHLPVNGCEMDNARDNTRSNGTCPVNVEAQ